MPARARLTERQNQAFEFVRTYVRREGKPPTLREIGAALGIRSSNGVHKLVSALAEKGYLVREPNAARGLRLVDAERDPFALDDGPPSLPLISRTASDQPERLRERPAAYFSIDPFFLRGTGGVEACLLARAGDDGMNGDGIHKGDFLIIEEMDYARLRNGDLAAFLMADVLVARRYHFTNDRLHLRPADRHYKEETFVPSDPGCHVVGKIVGVLRRIG